MEASQTDKNTKFPFECTCLFVTLSLSGAHEKMSEVLCIGPYCRDVVKPIRVTVTLKVIGNLDFFYHIYMKLLNREWKEIIIVRTVNRSKVRPKKNGAAIPLLNNNEWQKKSIFSKT